MIIKMRSENDIEELEKIIRNYLVKNSSTELQEIGGVHKELIKNNLGNYTCKEVVEIYHKVKSDLNN